MCYSDLTVGLMTLGCKVNQYESEAIAEGFEALGFTVQAPSKKCDVYIINTCTVTAESDRKSRQFVRRALHLNPNAYVLVIGCLAQTQAESIAKIQGVDYIGGNANKMDVVKIAKELVDSGKKSDTPTVKTPPADSFGFEAMHISKFDRTRAYVKIEDGCESHCTYCIIPTARGKIRSKPREEVLAEVKALTDAGCREIVLTGIETASYGKDLDGYDLGDLLYDIDRIDGIGRIRLGSLDPSLMKQKFVDRIAGLRSLAPQFHLSMQSGSDRILALMKRKYNRQMALDGMERMRKAIPDVQFTTDMIVGFPQESQEDFEDTLCFARQAEFLMIHVFPYSKRTGTVAAQMDGQIPESVKHERVKILSDEESIIRRGILDRQMGKVVPVLFETYHDGTVHGHTPSFLEVACPASHPLPAVTATVRLERHDGLRCYGTILEVQS